MRLGTGTGITRAGARNRSPTDIAWAGSHTVAEDAALGTQVGGALSFVDPDAEDTGTFTLPGNAGGRFAIGGDGASIIVAGVLDYETATSHEITIRFTDAGGLAYQEAFTVTVSDVSESAPENPLPPDGEADVDDAASFEILPTATIVDGGVKIHGKKSANGATGKFLYDVDNFAANTTRVLHYTTDWSLLTNGGKNAFLGFGARDGNAFDLVGLRGDGATGVHKVRLYGDAPNGWSQLSGHTVSDGGAAQHGSQAEAWIALTIRADGTHFDFWTSAAGVTFDSEYSNQSLGALASLVGNDVDGLAAVFAGTDSGPFAFKPLDYHVVPAPTVTSANTKSVAENAALSHTLTASQTVTWSIAGGADQAQLEISGSTLRWSSNGTRDYEAPADANTDNAYAVTVRATNVFGQATDQTITVTVTDVDDTAPTITSSNTASVAENATLAHALTANETVTWSIVGGADQAKFEISSSTLRFASNGTKNFEAPDDANTDNGYVVTVRATDTASNTSDQTITVTVTNATEYSATWWDGFSDGNRTGTITVTTDASISSGPINKLVDGSLALSLFWSGGQSGRTIKFDFGSGAAVVIDAFGWRQDAGAAHGTWVMEGSNDDSAWTQVGSSFSLGVSGQPQVFYTFTNDTPYRYYRLRQTAGTTSGTPFLLEINFRAASSAGLRDPYEKGDRTSLITVTTTASVSAGSAINNLIDGNLVGSVGDSFVFGAAESTRQIKFDLGSGVQKKITDFIWLQSTTTGHGTWVMEGSNDDSSYTGLGSSFTLGGAAISKYNLSNSTAYRYYRLRQTAGSTSTAPFINEIEFKIAP